jgi:hypothetical protein
LRLMSDHGTVCDVILTCQAGIVLDYCEAAFTESPILKQLIANARPTRSS